MTLFGQLDTHSTQLSMKIDSGGTFSPLKVAALNRFSAEGKHGNWEIWNLNFPFKTFEQKTNKYTSLASKHYRV